MKNVKILYNFKEEKIKKESDKDLIWYDDIKKEMVCFKGEKLGFKYEEDEYLVKKGFKNTYRMLPYVAEKYKISYDEKNNKNNVLKVIGDYLNYNNYYLNIVAEYNDGIEIEIEDNGYDDFCYELERKGYNYV